MALKELGEGKAPAPEAGCGCWLCQEGVSGMACAAGTGGTELAVAVWAVKKGLPEGG
jgi:hypothetical protein